MTNTLHICLCSTILAISVPGCGGKIVFDGGDQREHEYHKLDGNPRGPGGSFSMPEDHPNMQKYREFHASSGPTDSDRRRVSNVWLRNYIANPEGREVLWMRPDTDFAYDGVLSIAGDAAEESQKLTFRVFVDFEVEEFALKRVDEPDGWAPRSSFDALDTSKKHTVTLKRGEPLNYTLVLPSQNIGAKGIHDVRIVTLRQGQAGGEELRFSALGSLFRSWGYSIIYGSYDLAKEELPTFPGVQRVKPSINMRQHVRGFDGSLVFPSWKEHVLQATSVAWPLKLGKRFEVPEGGSASVLIAGSGNETTPGVNYYVVLEDGEPSEEYRGIASIGDAPNYSRKETDREFANRFSIGLHTSSGPPRRVRVLSFPAPYGNWLEMRNNRGRNSNILHLGQ